MGRQKESNMVDHENVLEKCLPIPHGFTLIKIVNNTMYLMRDEKYEKIQNNSS